ncbi:MAG: hypothetical protein GY757_58540 [bacterium]|nr:hypothetical protein [bacterium]
MKSFKKSNLVKKLALNKSTIINLDKNEYQFIKAGIDETFVFPTYDNACRDSSQVLTLSDKPLHQNTC